MCVRTVCAVEESHCVEKMANVCTYLLTMAENNLFNSSGLYVHMYIHVYAILSCFKTLC